MHYLGIPRAFYSTKLQRTASIEKAAKDATVYEARRKEAERKLAKSTFRASRKLEERSI